MVHSYGHAERIWQSSSVEINPQRGNGAGRPLEWIELGVDVVPGRDGPENLRILKRRVNWGSTVEVRSWVFRIWLEQISLGLDRQGWVEILTPQDAPCVWERGASIVWLADTFMICVSLLASPTTEGRTK